MAKKKPGPKPKEGITREDNGRASRNPEATKARREAAIRTVVEARARHLGLLPPTLKQLPGETMEEFMARKGAREAMLRAATPAMRREWTGCSVGQAIADEPDVAQLWEAAQRIRSARASYLSAIDAPDEHAKTARLPVKPSSEQTAPEAREVRGEPMSEEDAADAAILAWERMSEAIQSVHPMAVRFAIDRICAEVPGADANPVPKAPLLMILRGVHAKVVAGEKSA